MNTDQFTKLLLASTTGIFPISVAQRGRETRSGCLLQDPRYVGMHVWGKTTAPLSTPVKRLPVSDWIVYPKAFAPIISLELFVAAQEVIADFTVALAIRSFSFGCGAYSESMAS